ncbi:cobalt import ATP-binding protein CbiO 2 [Nautilia profundicola AmH]|uniref:Cobalt import ATP-binding protein CbiO 2 n=1 Tax=Nautilia profundicola (strain ATCC BAA-1463 / DSM 18972 / AmH) TaxID=598659 RepID=B9L931_NAUPA|nr:energy-coupling factor ABC transporter ATP-binding protein [Nautilia profundicola]ACM92424.1 cobalt import ATP-binding protein CbiO 2 [Nautilia profundicola AmH]
MNEIVSIKNGYFYYEDNLALENINLEVKEKEKLVLLGNNGSGKSTLLRVIARLYFLNRGEYRFEGKPLKKRKVKKEFRSKVGILFQNPDAMIFNPTVYDEIAFSLKEFGFDNVDDRVIEIAKEFNIEKLLKKSPLELSGGEKQKVMLASIMVYEPKLLLLDEPTAAMDPRTTGWFIDFIYDLDITAIIATHDLAVAYELSDRAVVMDEGHKIVYDGDMEELMKNLDVLLQANLIHKHRHRHKKFIHSHYHLHF